LKLLTLNIERDLHLDRVLEALTTQSPDVACLQEVLECDCDELARAGGYAFKFAPAAIKHRAFGDKRTVREGIAIFTRIPARTYTAAYYSADAVLRVFREPADSRQVLLAAELEHEGKPYRVITTHFTWSPDGQISDAQREDFERLKRALTPYSGFVLCGDFNAPRGREMFSRFEQELRLTDQLPAGITTTIDPKHHRAGALQLVVDTIFTTHDYEAQGVEVLEGLSDHKGILATVRRRSDE
jgi:endonuclease/exonuclease/phosphatase family metal-dependent hydrolase